MESNTITPVKSEPAEYQESDVFVWTNNLQQYKDQLDLSLYFFTKTGVIYRAKLSGDLTRQIQPLFIDEILEYVINGAADGLVVRGFEDAESEENVLQRTKASNVDQLQEVLNHLTTQEHEIENFVEEDHDIKRIKGMLLKGIQPGSDKPFYVIKQMPRAQVLKGVGAWLTDGTLLKPLAISTALRIPADNQLLVIDEDLYVFSQSKLETLFGYNAKKNSIAEKMVRAIEANFKLSFAEGLTMQSAVKGSRPLINKLQKINPSLVKQDQLVDHAEEMSIDLMLDEEGAIIIMDTKDLVKFINLLNDDYIESGMTGQRYEIKSKKLLINKSDEDL